MATLLKFFPCPNCGKPISSNMGANMQIILLCKTCGYYNGQNQKTTNSTVSVNISTEQISINNDKGMSILKWTKKDWEKDKNLILTIAHLIKMAYENPTEVLALFDKGH